VFLADCRRVLADADRAARRVQAASRGEAGTLRLAYTLVSAFETVPLLLDRLERDYPLLRVDAQHHLSDRGQIELGALRDETLELWPREMAPGYYEAIIAACHSAGFEPNVDQHGAGSTGWGYIAEGRGVGLVVSSLVERLPRGVKLLDLAPPRPMLTVNAVWRGDQELPAIERLFETAKQLSQERHWS